MPQLRLYQLEAVKELLDKKRILIADDMGLGKTAEAIVGKRAVENRQGKKAKTLIVCPASVTQHWENEIGLWYPEKNKVARIQTPTFDSDVRSAEDADFVITGYPTLSYLGGGNKVNDLGALGFQYGIIDEAHNAKNPDSIRSTAVKKLFDSMEYLAILSGTPIPNSIVDIYVLLSLLDKDSFPLEQENSRYILSSFYRLFRQDPEFVKRVLDDRKLNRKVEQYLHSSFPGLKESDLEVRLNGEHEEVYREVYENDEVKPGRKLIQLRKAALDPNLVDPRLLSERLASRIGEMESSVYTSLDTLLKEIADSGGKALIFSDFKVGVTDKLKERYKRYGAEVIDGDVSSEKHDDEISIREEIRRKFQRDPDCKVLIATTVMDEGVDLTAATDEIHLTLPYTPAAFDQRIRRVQRIGEIKKDSVTVHVVKPRLDEFTPVITEGIENLLKDKRRIVEFIEKPSLTLTKEDLDEIKNGKPHKSMHLSSLLVNPASSVFSHLGILKGKGVEKIRDHYKKYPEEAKIFAGLYASHWDGYYGGNTATLTRKVIDILGERQNLDRKLDVGSGPFSLSRRLQEPVVNLDINEQMFNAGRLLENEGLVVPGNVAAQGSFHQLPFRENSFDLVNYSLTLHMSKKGKERKQVLEEMNRVLRKNGYALITVPYSVISERNLPSFHEGLEQLGFEVLPFSGFYKGPEETSFEVYLAGLKKIRKPSVDVDEDFFDWKMDEKSSGTKGHSKSPKKNPIPDPKIIEKKVINSFYSKNGTRLEDYVRERS